jgi:hypothetical protein
VQAKFAIAVLALALLLAAVPASRQAGLRHDPETLPGKPSRYTCYASDGAVVDQGTLTCVTSRACGDFSC